VIPHEVHCCSVVETREVQFDCLLRLQGQLNAVLVPRFDLALANNNNKEESVACGWKTSVCELDRKTGLVNDAPVTRQATRQHALPLVPFSRHPL
jgi:hypothetical protein